MVTEAQPEITPQGILLTLGSVKMLLSTEAASQTSAPSVNYRIWEVGMDTYGPAAEVFEPLCKGSWVVDYETDIPAASAVTLTTTLKRQ